MPLPDPMPSYAELPIRPGLPAGSAWGVFGDESFSLLEGHLSPRMESRIDVGLTPRSAERAMAVPQPAFV